MARIPEGVDEWDRYFEEERFVFLRQSTIDGYKLRIEELEVQVEGMVPREVADQLKVDIEGRDSGIMGLEQELADARAEIARLKAEILKWEEYAGIPEEDEMSGRVARKLRGHARLLRDIKDSIGFGYYEDAAKILNGVIENILRDADEEEQRGKDWAADPLRGYAVARKRELEELGIEEQERKMTPPQGEAWL